MAASHQMHMRFAESDDHCESNRTHACTELYNELDEFPEEAFRWTSRELHDWLLARDRHISTHGEDDCGLTIEEIRIIDWAVSFIERCANGNCSCRIDQIDSIAMELFAELAHTGLLRHSDGPLLYLPSELGLSTFGALMPLDTVAEVEVDFDGTTGTLTVTTEDRQVDTYELILLGTVRCAIFEMLCGIEAVRRDSSAWDLATRVAALDDPVETALLHRRRADADRYDSIDDLLDETGELTAELRRLDEGLTEALLATGELAVDDLVATVRRLAS